MLFYCVVDDGREVNVKEVEVLCCKLEQKNKPKQYKIAAENK